MIVDSTALLDQVADDVVASAFLSAGQRCSALRILLLQEDIAERAMELILGAMNELRLGDPAELSTDIGPVIDAEALASLKTHVKACRRAGYRVHVATGEVPQCGTFLAPHLIEVSDLAKLTVEQFGPILHVVRFVSSRLEVELGKLHKLGFALTMGVHSRIEQRVAQVFSASRAGNTYVNRNMVGAVVGVQPFGGSGLSGTGPKAGGPHYLQRFATERTLTENTMARGGNIDLLREDA
jgi:RHH-type proline utilization regulon transcriptional repressor/proline dehydrogenase/delta 1-pyrroline-5-carboxylate dehydrogenase